MCGILFSITSTTSPPLHPTSTSLPDLISRRGPDTTNTHVTAFENYALTFTSSVLSLRGRLTPQPLVDPVTGSVLCWNGEAWRINSALVPAGVNDGEEVLKLLLSAETPEKGFAGIAGPWACVFFDAVRGRVWYGRDCLGRRSLLELRKGGWKDGVTIASVGDGHEGWKEVEAYGLRYFSLQSGEEGVVPFLHREDRDGGQVSMELPFPKLNRNIEPDGRLNTDSPEVGKLKEVLLGSVRIRVGDIPEPPGPGRKVRLAVLFSGGLDCSVIARLVHECLPLDEAVDLLNVAFENRRFVEARNKANKANKPKRRTQHPEAAAPPEDPQREGAVDPYSICPDRITGLATYDELQKVCPGRLWNFIQINVPYTDLLSHRQSVINLIHPHNTEMDLSIGVAFYFASRGTGYSFPGNQPYSTPARILLSGLGADELLGGYARHGTAFRSRSYAGLLEELQLDVGRLGKRNLGRDDRVLAHWGREARYPFLDEDVVAWCLSTGVIRKCGGSEEEVVEGKRVLRLLAGRLGMQEVAREKKRAVQFGSRSARMEAGEKGRVKGTAVVS
ncbi:unnamed protein product [Tuber melanosporum]|uniref:(Perigord truffle) hypothetical protein n=1 Tax=Tuber melanosporum (strain Mel28) TaxID=656061 RepID=D5G8L6_TUBMM|nr:uncharacterized protein GSTUM_00003001001 [Tuber melanosporum]CAZ80859.1 unnamed protein product [Tuber melanosporum]